MRVEDPHYYIDTASVFDLDAYGLIKRLRKVKIVIVQEVLNEIKDRNLKRRLVRIATDRGPEKRGAFIPMVNSLDYGERAVITAMVCDHPLRRRRIYVSNDTAALKFVGGVPNNICEDKMDTSDFVISLYKEGIVDLNDIRNMVSCNSRPPNKHCRKRLKRIIAGDDPESVFQIP